MQLHAIIAPSLLCLGALAASSISEVLRGLPDGGYITSMLDPSKGNHVNVTDLYGKPVPGSPFAIVNDAGARGPHTHTEDTWGCVAGEEVVWEDWWVSRNDLDAWCDEQENTLLPQHIYSWQYNGTTAFVCNYGEGQNCLGRDYVVYMKSIAENCGDVGTGWYHQAAGNQLYGRGIVGGKSDSVVLC